MTGSTKILTVGDIHFKKDNTKQTEELLSFLLERIKSKKYAFIVLLGDILHSFDKIDLWCYIRATEFIEKLAALIKVYVLIGNHDRPNNKSFCEENVHPFFLLKGKKNITVVDTPILEEIDNKKYLFVPYVEDERFEEAIFSLEKKLFECDEDNEDVLIFAHQNFKEAQFNSLIKSSCKESFGNRRIISGHIHEEQLIKNDLIKSDFNSENVNGDKNFLFYCGEKSVYEVYKDEIKRLYRPPNISSSKEIKKKEKKPENKEKVKIENEGQPEGRLNFIDFLYETKKSLLKDCHLTILKNILC